MSAFGDLKILVGLGALGLIGYGAYKIYKAVPNVQKDIENAVEDYNQQFSDSVAEAVPVQTIADATITFKNSVDTVQDLGQNIVEFFKESENKVKNADYSDPMTYVRAAFPYFSF